MLIRSSVFEEHFVCIVFCALQLCTRNRLVITSNLHSEIGLECRLVYEYVPFFFVVL